MIEPAAYGAAVCFGPKTVNFRDVVQLLLKDRAAIVVEDGPQMTAFVANCVRDATGRRELGERARRLVSENLGATRRSVFSLVTLLPSTPRQTSPSRRLTRHLPDKRRVRSE